MSTQIQKKRLLTVGFLLTLLYALHYAIPLYLLSTFLSQYLDTSHVSILYVTAYILTFLFIINLNKALYRFHNYHTAMTIIIIDLLATLGLAFATNIWMIGISFILFIICSALLFSIINLFIEQYKNGDAQANTGTERGIFLTLLNLGFLISPLLISRLVDQDNFMPAFIASAVCLVPMIILIKHYFADAPRPKYKSVSFADTFKKIRQDKNISGIMLTQFASESFVVMMVIYLPLYLYQTLHIPTTHYLGFMLPLALLPLVVLPYEFGWLADKKIGEKELLITGLVVIGLVSIIFPFVRSNAVFIWAIILLFSRIGYSLVQTMSYSYFFKKVHATDVGSISIFSNIYTLANIFVTMTAAIIFSLGGNIMFLALFLAGLAIFALVKIRTLVDTL